MTGLEIKKNYSNKLLKFSELIIVLFPVLLITGPLLPEVGMFILIISFFLLLEKKKIKIFFYRTDFKIFLFFWCIIVISSVFSADWISFIKSISYIRFGLFFLAINFFIEKKNYIFKNLFFILTAIFIFLFLDSFYQFFFKINLFGYKALDYPRISSIFNDEYILGSYVIRMLPIFFSMMLYYFNFKQNILVYIFSLLICSSIIILSGERVALFYLLIFYFFIFLLLIKIKFKYAFSGIIIFILLIIIAFSNNDLRKRYVNQTLDEFGLTKNKIYQKEYGTSQPLYKNIYIFSPAHQSYYLTAFNMFSAKPLFGHGLKSFRKKCSEPQYADNKNSCSTHPHNIYIEILSETGFLAFLIVLVIFIYFLKKIKNILSLKSISKNNLFLFNLYLFFIIALWPFIPTGSFYNNWLSMFFFYYLGFYKYKE